jgi:hypothetical protein
LQRCERTEAFLVSTCAAWCAGQAVVIAADAPRMPIRDALLERYPDAHVLDDALDLALDHAADHWPAAVDPDDLVAAILFTSGSTRVPREATQDLGIAVPRRAHVRRNLRHRPGAWTLAGHGAARSTCSGLEATVMAALRTGCALDATRPRFGTDLAALARANAEAKRAAALPRRRRQLHLEHFHRTPGRPPAVRESSSRRCRSRARSRRMSSATGGARVDEIYGSTECGMIAARRARSRRRPSRWATRLALDLDDDGSAIASGAQLDAPVALDDRLAWRDRRTHVHARRAQGRHGQGRRQAHDARGAGRPSAPHRRRRGRRVLPERGAAGPAVRARRRARRSTRPRCAAASPSASTRRSCRAR